jgi:hypothetical protein
MPLDVEPYGIVNLLFSVPLEYSADYAAEAKKILEQRYEKLLRDKMAIKTMLWAVHTRAEGWVPPKSRLPTQPAFGRGRRLFIFSHFRNFLTFFGRELRQTPGKLLATWHQFGTKTRRWSGDFLEWRGARSNGITMG